MVKAPGRNERAMTQHTSPSLMRFPGASEQRWIEIYIAEELAHLDAKTQYAYARILTDFALWVAKQPGSQSQFSPKAITKTAVHTYFNEKKSERKPLTKAELSRLVVPISLQEQPLRYSPTSLNRIKVALNGFLLWLIERGDLLTNPVKGLVIPRMAARPPRFLNENERYALKNIVERMTAPQIKKKNEVVAGDLRGAAIFALGYYAGLRVSDVSHLLVRDTHVGPKVGWIHAGYKRETYRDLDLLNAARGPLYDFLHQGKREGTSAYVFTSQRRKKEIPEGDEDAWRLTEDGIHQWFQDVRAAATVDEAELIDDITFHDLRHDFGHRLREQGWALEEVAYYLGHVNADGTPSIQTTVRYTQVGREQVKQKIRMVQSI